jgi:hypothetical protein
MLVKFDDTMRKLFTTKERITIRRTARGIAKRYVALRELRRLRNRPTAKTKAA